MSQHATSVFQQIINVLNKIDDHKSMSALLFHALDTCREYVFEEEDDNTGAVLALTIVRAYVNTIAEYPNDHDVHIIAIRMAEQFEYILADARKMEQEEEEHGERT